MKNRNSFTRSLLLLLMFSARLIYAEDFIFGLRQEDSFDYLEPLKSSSVERNLFSRDEAAPDETKIRENEDEATEKRSVTLHLLVCVDSINETFFFPRLIALGITR